VQTFLPFPSFSECAAVLDNKRLGKQRVENLQIMHALFEPEYGWQNHPAVKMWRGYERSFLDYQYFICHEWSDIRGYNDTCLEKTQLLYDAHTMRGEGILDDPWWLKNNWELHFSHQSNLIRKDPFYYGPQFPGVPSDLEYVWPV
jgi:hypothetical protein